MYALVAAATAADAAERAGVEQAAHELRSIASRLAALHVAAVQHAAAPPAAESALTGWEVGEIVHALGLRGYQCSEYTVHAWGADAARAALRWALAPDGAPPGAVAALPSTLQLTLPRPVVSPPSGVSHEEMVCLLHILPLAGMYPDMRLLTAWDEAQWRRAVTWCRARATQEPGEAMPAVPEHLLQLPSLLRVSGHAPAPPVAGRAPCDCGDPSCSA